MKKFWLNFLLLVGLIGCIISFGLWLIVLLFQLLQLPVTKWLIIETIVSQGLLLLQFHPSIKDGWPAALVKKLLGPAQVPK